MATRPPCLYAIELVMPNPFGARYYVGHSGAHTAECKANTHLHGFCICGVGGVNDRERSHVARRYGIGLFRAVKLSRADSRVQWDRSEAAWAQELALSTGQGVWCDGRVYQPG